jgi:hypothetical protein
MIAKFFWRRRNSVWSGVGRGESGEVIHARVDADALKSPPVWRNKLNKEWGNEILLVLLNVGISLSSPECSKFVLTELLRTIPVSWNGGRSCRFQYDVIFIMWCFNHQIQHALPIPLSSRELPDCHLHHLLVQHVSNTGFPHIPVVVNGPGLSRWVS